MHDAGHKQNMPQPLDLWKDSTIVVADSNHYGRMVHHLQQLKRALVAENVTAHVNSQGGSRVTLQVSDLPDDVTCRSNPLAGNKLWFYYGEESLLPASDRNAACLAAAKVIELRTQALISAVRRQRDDHNRQESTAG